jgi:hypothetical protein
MPVARRRPDSFNLWPTRLPCEKIRARLAFTVAHPGELAARMFAAPSGDERNEGRAEAARPSSGD